MQRLLKVYPGATGARCVHSLRSHDLPATIATTASCPFPSVVAQGMLLHLYVFHADIVDPDIIRLLLRGNPNAAQIPCVTTSRVPLVDMILRASRAIPASAFQQLFLLTPKSLLIKADVSGENAIFHLMKRFSAVCESKSSSATLVQDMSWCLRCILRSVRFIRNKQYCLTPKAVELMRALNYEHRKLALLLSYYPLWHPEQFGYQPPLCPEAYLWSCLSSATASPASLLRNNPLACLRLLCPDAWRLVISYF